MSLDHPDIAPQLYRALLKDTDRLCWFENSPIELEDGRVFRLPATVIKRARQPGKNGSRFEFINLENEVGAGGFGQVYGVTGTLQADQFKLTDRVVKISAHNSRESILNTLREYQQARQSGHAHIKIPTFRQTPNGNMVSYLFMRRAPGRTLYHILKDDKTLPEKRLSLQQRVELSIALLRALKTQITDRQLIHRDIKPDNLMVNLDSNPVSISIIDFGSAGATLPPGRTAHPFYASPECLSGQTELHSNKIDVYAISRVIALIWRVNWQSYSNLEFARSMDNMLNDLCEGIDDISEQQKTALHTLLRQGLEPDPVQRINLDNLLNGFQKLKQAASPAIYSSSSSPLFFSPLPSVAQSPPRQATSCQIKSATCGSEIDTLLSDNPLTKW